MFQFYQNMKEVQSVLYITTLWPFDACPEVKAAEVEGKSYDYNIVGGEHHDSPKYALLGEFGNLRCIRRHRRLRVGVKSVR